MYHDHLQIMDATKSQDDNRTLQAYWASRGWLQTVAETLGLLVTDRTLRSLRLKVTSEDVGQQQERANMFYNLVLGAATKRAWSMSIYDVAPYNWAHLLYYSTRADMQIAMNTLKDDCDIVKKALRLAGDRTCESRQARSLKKTLGTGMFVLTLMQFMQMVDSIASLKPTGIVYTVYYIYLYNNFCSYYQQNCFHHPYRLEFSCGFDQCPFRKLMKPSKNSGSTSSCWCRKQLGPKRVEY